LIVLTLNFDPLSVFAGENTFNAAYL
jgi:hypothetical protein